MAFPLIRASVLLEGGENGDISTDDATNPIARRMFRISHALWTFGNISVVRTAPCNFHVFSRYMYSVNVFN